MDAGVKLAGARKDQLEALENPAVPTTEPGLVTLESLWPIPEKTAELASPWQVLAQQIGPERAARVMVIHGNLAREPHPDGHFGIPGDVWALSFKAALHVIRNLLLKTEIVAIDELSSEYERLMKGFAQKYLGDKVIGRKQEIAAVYAVGRKNPKSLNHPFSLTAIEAMRFNTLARWGWGRNPRIPDRLAMGALRFVSRGTGETYWQSVEAVGGGWKSLDEGKFPTEDLALANTVKYVAKKLTAPPKPRTARPPELWTREPIVPGAGEDGVDLRSGFERPNASGKTAQDLIDVFGFRGVEFGNYVSQTQRRWFVDGAHDAFQDLAQLLGLPPRLVSLKGSLGIAYGSRGDGFVSLSAAHFERSNLVLHFTRDQGPGAMAHEMGHALDAWLLKTMELGKPSPGVNFASEFFWDSPRSVDDRQLDQAFGEWRRMVQSEPEWIRECQNMDWRERRSYWMQPCEIFARGFEVMVHEALAHRGRRNLMLVSGVSEQSGHELHDKGMAYPYPLGQERADVCQLMAGVIRAIKRSAREKLSMDPNAGRDQQKE